MRWAVMLALLLVAPAAAADDRATVLVVVGAAGAPEYADRFETAARKFAEACTRSGARCLSIGGGAQGAGDRDALAAALATETRREGGALWLVLVGHGTFDGRAARFNLRGPDVGADELATWLRPARRPVIILNTASASGPFIKALAAPGRVVVTATKTGQEQNATRLAGFLSEAVADPASDLDKDGQTSLLEAYLVAAKRVEASYAEAGLLATEHALLEDNGDGLGTAASFFQGIRPTSRPVEDALPDGHRAHQLHLIASAPEKKLTALARQRRDQLELEVIKLRELRGKIADGEYYARLEKMMLELARIYDGAR